MTNISLYNRKPWTGDSLHQPRKSFWDHWSQLPQLRSQEGQGACAVSQYYAHECHARQEIGPGNSENCPNWEPDLGTNILCQSLPIFTISGIFGLNIIQHIFGMPNINGIRSSWSNHNFSQQLAAQVVEILDARYSVFWQLPTIRGCDNPMLEDEREAGSTWSRCFQVCCLVQEVENMAWTWPEHGPIRRSWGAAQRLKQQEVWGQAWCTEPWWSSHAVNVCSSLILTWLDSCCDCI